MKNRFMKLTLTLAFMLLTSGITMTQTRSLLIKKSSRSPLNQPEENIQFIESREGQATTFMATRDGKIHTCDIDLTEEMDIIEEFKEEPFFIQQKKNSGSFKTMSVSSFMDRFDQFTNDLSQIQQKSSQLMKTASKPFELKRKFYKTFFGINLTVPRAALYDIQHLSYVKKIHLNKKLKAVLNESLPLIRADEVRSIYGTEGDSIVIGIIDTGIDYNHPALGGGFGPGYKVIGGYDIINNDNDPMDDYGHGTHVAGIVAADNEVIKGVAPKALLMAFKVLDWDGWGTEESVIAGIERAVDPNDDGDFSDMVDIANMSLSGPGNPDDAVSTAVDQAVELGVIFCVAASNEGEFGYNTIGSPGTARRAITVGATDKQDNIASFSSRGPNKIIYSIKPEIVAPGVDIYSTELYNEYQHHGGTSMAAPHAAGVCALLKAIHPDWTPEEIKSALMTTAIDIDQDAMIQGAGRIDALSAARVTAFASPAHLSFGIDDLNQTIWTVSDTVVITNQAAAAQDFSISFDPFIAGVNITADPASFSLNPQESQSVVFSLAVDNEIVPYPEEGSFGYDGDIFIQGTQDTLHLPWAFVEHSKVIITFDQPEVRFYMSNDKLYITSMEASWIDSYTAEFLLDPGIYDLFAYIASDIYTKKFVIKEQISIEKFLDLNVTFNDANHQINLAGVDKDGELLAAYTKDRLINFLFLYPENSSIVCHQFYKFENYVSFVSDISARFKCRAFESVFNGSEGYILQHPVIDSVFSDITLSNNPADYKKVDVEIQYPENSSRQKIHGWLSQPLFYPVSSGITMYLDFSWGWGYDVNSLNWQGTLYLTLDIDPFYWEPNVNQSFWAQIELSASTDKSRGGYDYWHGPIPWDFHDWIKTRPFKVIGDSIGNFDYEKRYRKGITHLVPDGGKLAFSAKPVYPDLGTSNFSSQIVVYLPEAETMAGALNERLSSDRRFTSWTIYDPEDNIKDSGDFMDLDNLQFYSRNLSPACYRLEIKNNDYYFKGVQGTATGNYWCDLTKIDRDPPIISSLQIRNSNGIPTYQLEYEESASLRFSAYDYLSRIDSICVCYKKFNTDSWFPLDVEKVSEGPSNYGILYSINLSDLTAEDSSAYGIKIHIEDQSGNAAEWILDPAIKVGNFNIPTIVTDNQEQALIPQKFALLQNYPNPFNPSTTMSFALPKRERVKIKIYDILGREIRTLVNKTMQAGIKKVEWDGRDNKGNPVPTGIYFYKLEAGDFTDIKKMLMIK
jgi:subtilisin family serine protease